MLITIGATLTAMSAALLTSTPAQADQGTPLSPPVLATLHQDTSATAASNSSDAGTSAAAKRCASGWFCVWPKANFQGKSKGGTKPGTCYTPFTPAGHSVSNQTGRKIRVYASAHCKGSYFDLPTGHYSNPTPFGVRSVKIH